jgi:hypothetical protein
MTATAGHGDRRDSDGASEPVVWSYGLRREPEAGTREATEPEVHPDGPHAPARVCRIQTGGPVMVVEVDIADGELADRLAAEQARAIKEVLAWATAHPATRGTSHGP